MIILCVRVCVGKLHPWNMHAQYLKDEVYAV